VNNAASKRRLISRTGAGEKPHPPNTPAASEDAAAKNFQKEIRNAIEAGRFWEPQGIAHSQLLHAGKLTLQQIVGELRRRMEKLNVSDERILASDLLGLIRAMVARLNWLAKAGKLADAPRYHEDWPINYAPDAGEGASKWEAAKKIYQKLGCGKDAPIQRIAGQVSYENRWTELAEAAVRAALLPKLNASWVDKKIKDAKESWHWTHRPYGRIKIEYDCYFCRDGWVIAWPSWAQQSRGLPDKLRSSNWQEFLLVIRELVRIFLYQDEKRMREYLNAAGGDDLRKSAWDADVFNNLLMKKVKRALKSLACR
jgi:hypothetical protein